MAKPIKILKSSTKKQEECPKCQQSEDKQTNLSESTQKEPKDELIEELLGVLMDATPAQVDAYIKEIKRGSSN